MDIGFIGNSGAQDANQMSSLAKQLDDMPNRILRLIRNLDIAEGASFFSLADLNRILSEPDLDLEALTETEKIIEMHKRSRSMRTFMGPSLSEELIQFMTTQEKMGQTGKEWFNKLTCQLCTFFDHEKRAVSIFTSSLDQKKNLSNFSVLISSIPVLLLSIGKLF